MYIARIVFKNYAFIPSSLLEFVHSPQNSPESHFPPSLCTIKRQVVKMNTLKMQCYFSSFIISLQWRVRLYLLSWQLVPCTRVRVYEIYYVRFSGNIRVQSGQTKRSTPAMSPHHSRNVPTTPAMYPHHSRTLSPHHSRTLSPHYPQARG